ncbi:MAG TPA: SDR family oxidoreductase [Longilinea sp.]|nr:SDR family oxidoreductase [Longilinea sp.]
MKTVVITGSTRGIGFALAREFLKRGCQVVISGRKNEGVEASVNELTKEFPAERIDGFQCDVTSYDQVKELWERSGEKFGHIDIWINNAGISNGQALPWEIPPDELKSVVDTNILGELYGTKVAMQGFLAQGFGALYNMEGLGANGKTNNVRGLSVYGMTKAGLHYFNKCLAQEINHPRIISGSLQPGMVLTDMVRGQYIDKPDEWEKVKGILGIISSPVNGVAAWLVNMILTNQKNGVHFGYGGTLRILKRMFLAQFNKNREKP